MNKNKIVVDEIYIEYQKKLLGNKQKDIFKLQLKNTGEKIITLNIGSPDNQINCYPLFNKICTSVDCVYTDYDLIQKEKNSQDQFTCKYCAHDVNIGNYFNDPAIEIIVNKVHKRFNRCDKDDLLVVNQIQVQNDLKYQVIFREKNHYENFQQDRQKYMTNIKHKVPEMKEEKKIKFLELEVKFELRMRNIVLGVLENKKPYYPEYIKQS